jgi:hypothetical protein
MCSHSFSLNKFSDFPGLHDSHRFQQLKSSLYKCQPTAQSANVGEEHVTRTSDNSVVLAHSRALGKLDHQMHTAWNTMSLQDYLVQVTLPYIILIQMSFKFAYFNLNNSQLRNNSNSINFAVKLRAF